MKQEIHPKELSGAKLKSIDKYGEFIFDTDEGLWKIPPVMLVGITDSDLYAIGKLVRFTKNGKDKYRWIEEVEEKVIVETHKPVKKNGLGKAILKKFIK